MPANIILLLLLFMSATIYSEVFVARASQPPN